MPLIILTGYPASGLSYRASQLAVQLPALDPTNKYKVTVIPSHDAAHPRTDYDAGKAEKQARAVTYSRMRKALVRDTIVIVDGMNYIKGWRYQMWCEAKAAGTTSCVVHVGAPAERCFANNERRIKRTGGGGGDGDHASVDAGEAQQMGQDEKAKDKDDGEDPYPPDLFDNLIYRYEEPSNSARWDKPLFTVPWIDPDPPSAAIFSALTGITVDVPEQQQQPFPLTPSTSTGAPSVASSRPGVGAGISLARRAIKPKVIPHQATVQPPSTSPDALNAFEKRTSDIIAAIRSFTLEHPSASAAMAETTARLEAAAAANDSAFSPRSRGIAIPVPHAPPEQPIFVPATAIGAADTDALAGPSGVLALPRLQRLRRTWIGMNRAFVTGGHGRMQAAMDPEQVGGAFVRFLNEEFGGSGFEEE